MRHRFGAHTLNPVTVPAPEHLLHLLVERDGLKLVLLLIGFRFLADGVIAPPERPIGKEGSQEQHDHLRRATRSSLRNNRR